MQGEAGGQADFRNVDLGTVALIFGVLAGGGGESQLMGSAPVSFTVLLAPLPALMTLRERILTSHTQQEHPQG